MMFIYLFTFIYNRVIWHTDPHWPNLVAKTAKICYLQTVLPDLLAKIWKFYNDNALQIANVDKNKTLKILITVIFHKLFVNLIKYSVNVMVHRRLKWAQNFQIPIRLSSVHHCVKNFSIRLLRIYMIFHKHIEHNH